MPIKSQYTKNVFQGNDLSPQIINNILKLRKATCNLRNVHLFENKNPGTKRYGLGCIDY